MNCNVFLSFKKGTVVFVLLRYCPCSLLVGSDPANESGTGQMIQIQPDLDPEEIFEHYGKTAKTKLNLKNTPPPKKKKIYINRCKIFLNTHVPNLYHN